MNWQGRISGSDGIWGDAGADRVIRVVEDLAPAPLPARLLPNAGGTDQITLGPLGVLSARDRLALIGFQHLNPHWDGVAILVGDTGTHWATLSAREIIHLQTSALPAVAHGLGLSDHRAAPGPDMEAAQDRPERLMLLLGAAQDDDARLSMLLGAEIGSTRTLWLGQQAVLIGEGVLTRGYAHALSAAHVPVTLTDHGALIGKGFEALAALFDTDPE